MLKATIFSCWLIASVFSNDWFPSKWSHEENALHDCRSCKAVPIDMSNCPSDSYCDPRQPLRAAVLTMGSCHCRSIACSGRGWRLAVNGTIVDRIKCKGREWYTIHGETVPSAICAKAGHGTPATTTVYTTPGLPDK